MEIIVAHSSHADMVGEVHSTAWKDTYKDIFSTDYINQDNIQKRKDEFLNTLDNNKIIYYLLLSHNIAFGIIKVALKPFHVCEIESIYIIKEYRGFGYGNMAIVFIKALYTKSKIVLWVLEENYCAIKFYEKNGFKFSGQKRIINRGIDYYQKKYEYFT